MPLSVSQLICAAEVIEFLSAAAMTTKLPCPGYSGHHVWHPSLVVKNEAIMPHCGMGDAALGMMVGKLCNSQAHSGFCTFCD